MSVAEFYGIQSVRVTAKNAAKIGKLFVQICCKGKTHTQAQDLLLQMTASGLFNSSDNGYLGMWHEVNRAYGASL